MSNSNNKQIILSTWDIISCPRGIFYKKRKEPLPLVHPEIAKIRENYTRAAEAGKIIQKRLINKWSKENTLVSKGYKIPNDWGLSCEFDAIRRIKEEYHLYEIKGVSQDFFNRIKQTKKPRPDNRVQLMIYYHFLRGKYPGLKPILLYVNRKNYNEALAMIIKYNQEEIEKIHQITDRIRESILSNNPPNPIENIIFDTFEKKYIVNPVAIICDYHSLCCNDDYWYLKAVEQISKFNKQLKILNK